MKNDNKLIDKYVDLDYDHNTNDIWLQNSITLRRLIGVAGILLPFLLWFFLLIDSGTSRVLPSISHYYFTRVDGLFIIIISLMAIFLIVYKGKEPIDFVLSFVAGLSALILILFPTNSLIGFYPDSEFPFANTILSESSIRVMIHYIAAGLFLTILSVMSLFLFTKSNKSYKERGKEKNFRNRIYRTCGIGMLLALMVIGLYGIGVINEEFYCSNNLTFWMEVVAVELFGISWLVKGEVMFKDK